MTDASLFACGTTVVFVFIVGCYLAVRRSLNSTERIAFEMYPTIGSLPNQTGAKLVAFEQTNNRLRTQSITPIK